MKTDILLRVTFTRLMEHWRHHFDHMAWLEPIVVTDGPHDYVVMSKPAYIEQQQKLDVARAALKQASAWFAEYERLHRAKGTEDGHLKADANAERAAHLFEAAK